MFVSKTVSLDLGVLYKLEELVESGKYSSVSEFIQIAVNIELHKRLKD